MLFASQLIISQLSLYKNIKMPDPSTLFFFLFFFLLIMVAQSLPILPFDCIYNILQELQYAHKSSLFNWLFLSRLWCEQTIQFIWKNPLLISHKCSFKNKVSFIRTLFLFFDQAEISKLKQLDI